MASSAVRAYHARLQRALRYIEDHLDDELSVEILAGVAAFSKHHFHRQFSDLFGITVFRYIQLARLKRASYRLAFRDDGSVLDVALDSGFDGPEAFARAFKRHLGQTPSDFRRQPDWTSWQATLAPLSDTRKTHMKTTFSGAMVQLVEVADIRVAVLEHRGDPALIGDSVRRFIAWRKEVKLPPRVSATYNIFYDDSDTIPPADFRLDLCAATDRQIAPNDAGIVAKVIPGGRCAVLRHVGPDEGLRDAIIHLYADWLPQSGEEPRDFPLYIQRVSFFPDVPENEAVTDIFLPLK